MVRERLGGLHSADILLRSIDFEPMEELQRRQQWQKAGTILSKIAVDLQEAGADFILVCTNTMHIVAPQLERVLDVPLLHIADTAGTELQHRGIRRAGLLGTRFTMQQEFYRGRITEKFGIDIVVPDEAEQELVDTVIYGELCKGMVKNDSKERYLEVISRLSRRGAEGVILGCTEIPLLVQPGDADIPLIDTTDIHAKAAVELALG
jgi:aspartate racemase